jgi:hypothetical protein
MQHTVDGDISVTVLSSPEETLRSLQQIVYWADDLYLAYAWASSDQGQADHWRALPIGKIRKAIIGIHFAQTEPWVLERLAKRSGILKVVEDTTGVYHPKVLAGTRGGDARALIGSSNFTRGGFAGNTELNVLLEGPSENAALARILQFVEAQWLRSFEPDADWLTRYRDAHARRPLPPRLPRPPGEIAVVSQKQDLDISWPEYYELIKAQEGRRLANGAEIHVFDHRDGSYLQEAEACRHAFDRYATLAAMPLEERRLVAGWGRESSGYFGRMAGAGYFKNLVRTSPQVLDQFLDAIPLTGDVQREQVESCLVGLKSLHGISIATATRLLSMKRQDRFVTLNDANHRRIRELFGRIPYSVRGYLHLHDQLGIFAWTRAPEPINDKERRVWHARVALLDALLYEAPSAESGPPGFAPTR